MENTKATKQQLQVIIDTTNTTKEESSNLSKSESPETSALTVIHAGYFRISLSFGAQALLWKVLSSKPEPTIWHVYSRFLPSTAFLLLWCVALSTQTCLFLAYAIKCTFKFGAVKAEFVNPIGVNYLYAPWIAWLLLLQSSPFVTPNSVLYQVLCWVFVVPIVVLDLKLYGQWFTTNKRFLSVMANPTSQVSVIGNLVAAQAAAQMGWGESAVCLFSLGIVHYLILFVTLYQRLSSESSFPAALRPTFFLFFATPSIASLAWHAISGGFDTTAKMFFFLGLFVFTSLICRPALFKKSMRKLSVTWWAYSFPLTFLALASAEYAQEVQCHTAVLLMLSLSVTSVFVFLGLMLLTAARCDRLLQKKKSAPTSLNIKT